MHMSVCGVHLHFIFLGGYIKILRYIVGFLYLNLLTFLKQCVRGSKQGKSCLYRKEKKQRERNFLNLITKGDRAVIQGANVITEKGQSTLATQHLILYFKSGNEAKTRCELQCASSSLFVI